MNVSVNIPKKDTKECPLFFFQDFEVCLILESSIVFED